jgi:hypothetical protein
LVLSDLSLRNPSATAGTLWFGSFLGRRM